MQLGLNCCLKKGLKTFLNDGLEAEPFMLWSQLLLEKSSLSLPGPLLGWARVLFLLEVGSAAGKGWPCDCQEGAVLCEARQALSDI